MKITQFKRKYKNVPGYRDALQQLLVRDLSKIKKKKVLEIGCGTWDFAKKILERNKCKWTGIEPVDFGNDNLTDVKGSVVNLPFHNNTFDLVLCNQTIEHWFEYDVSFEDALKEINRVLKHKGILMVNTGIHIHGHPYFVRGDLKRIARPFDKKIWKIMLFEKGIPFVKIKGWQRLGSTGWQSKIGYPDFLVKNSDKAYSYLLNIHALKINKTSTEHQSNILKQFMTIIRFFKELILYYF